MTDSAAHIINDTSLTLSPVLTTLRDLLKTRKEEVNAWFASQHQSSPPPFYSSVDLRHSGSKLAPVDTNLFPAGFNHLSTRARTRAVEQIRARLSGCDKGVKRALIIPENHTRNQGYIDNLSALTGLIEEAGIEVEIGSLIAEDAPIEVTTSEGIILAEQPLTRTGNRLHTRAGFTPDLILMNNDLTSGFPEILRGVTQSIAPRPGLGWYRRRKSIHFESYDQLARQFAHAFSLDPWLIVAEFEKCGHVNFGERQGLECVALAVEKLLHRVREKNAARGITTPPYAFIKSDSGTYGMGIMTVRSGEEVFEMNKKIRNKMNVIKEGVQNTEVIIQEGIATSDRINGNPAEPMIYLMNGIAVGGAFRVNGERDSENNLNASGMRFIGMCDEDDASHHSAARITPCHFGAYSIVAQLASLAAEREEYGENYAI
jgi:glutamate--cysteine ligase